MRHLGWMMLMLGLMGCQSEEAAKTPTAAKTKDQAPGETSCWQEPVEPPEPTPLGTLSAEEIQAGWIQLFDGETLFGWEANDAGQPEAVNWRVENGAITADAGSPGLLLTPVPFADYEFRCEYRLEKAGNSGVFLRTVPKPANPAVDCYELNFCETHEAFPTASLVGRHKVPPPNLGDHVWVKVHVTVNGPTIQASFAGKEVLHFTDASEHQRLIGRIGLQKNAGKIEFRRVALKPLSTKPLFNGTDLTGWREVPGSKSQFEVKDKSIQVTSGLGFLETEDTFGDFVLQAEAITHGDGLNSGIFFRAMPGNEKEPSNGYEMQIHNGYKNNDPTQPVDAGTGAIFRRQNARRVVSRDHEWFTLTLVAFGPRFATWVNGYPVLVWEDDRKPDENPRRGQRLAAGHLSLQGHDPTTNLAFRNLRIAPMDGQGSRVKGQEPDKAN